MADPQHHAELGQAGQVREPPLEARQGHAEDGGGFPWLTAFGFAFLTFNSGMAIYRSNGDCGSIAFVAFSYVDLVMLFIGLRWYERGDRTSARGCTRRAWLKACVWALTTLLIAMFSYKVAAIMPPPMAIMVWLMTFIAVGGFFAFFLHKERAPAP